MMFWIAGYILFVVYAAGLFMYSVSHDRPWAAIGVLLGVSGFQFAVMETVDTTLAIGVAVVGALLVGRDLIAAIQPRFAAAIVRNDSDSCTERA